jgi:hypothetical protein
VIKYPDAWSYSAWEQYEQCPHKYEGYRVLKNVKQEVTPALADGKVFHDEVAKFITLPAGVLPTRKIHDRILPLVISLRDDFDDKIVEMQWGLTASWKETGWFTKGPKATWLRVILDVGVIYEDATALVLDWKTGKRYDSNDEQMELFALTTFAKYAWVNEVETRLEYVDTGDEIEKTFKREQAPELTAKWNERARIMLSDRTFTPRPNDKCFFCARSRQKGGDCRFG